VSTIDTRASSKREEGYSLMRKHSLPDDRVREQESRISLLAVERLLAGELEEAEAANLRGRLHRNPLMSAYLQRMESLAAPEAPEKIRALMARERHSSEKSPYRHPERRRSAPTAFGHRLRTRPALVWATVSLLLVLGTSIWVYRPVPHTRYLVKGADDVAVKVVKAHQVYDPGSDLIGRAGDSLGFVYRSPDSVFVQIWYREDGEEAQPVAGGDHPLVWPGTLSWIPAPQKILLEGSWTVQDIWVVCSRHTLTSDRVRDFLTDGDRLPRAVELFHFTLRSSPSFSS
jgi:hypothetical protein